MHARVQLNERQRTPEGHEASFATNALGTAALTQRLLPALVAGAPSRVIFVSSGGLYTGMRGCCQRVAGEAATALQRHQHTSNSSNPAAASMMHACTHARTSAGMPACMMPLAAPLLLDDLGHERLQPWDGVASYARDKRRQLALTEHLAATWAQHGACGVDAAAAAPAHPHAGRTGALHRGCRQCGRVLQDVRCAAAACAGVSVYAMHPGWADTEGVRTRLVTTVIRGS